MLLCYFTFYLTASFRLSRTHLTTALKYGHECTNKYINFDNQDVPLARARDIRVITTIVPILFIQNNHLAYG